MIGCIIRRRFSNAFIDSAVYLWYNNTIMKKFILFLSCAALALSAVALAACGRDQDVPTGAFYDCDLESGVLVNTDVDTVRVRWAAEEGANQYILYHSPSRFGVYERVAELPASQTFYEGAEFLYDSFKVTAVVGGEEVEVGRSSTFSDRALLIDQYDDMEAVQSVIDDTHASLESANGGQFSSQRAAFLFLPGTYDLTAKVGYYTSVNGLGEVPTDVSLGGVYVSDKVLTAQNATCTFWRSVENVSVRTSVTWSVSQATSFRRTKVEGDLSLSYGGYASGGFVANTVVTGNVHGGRQQQWMTRNTEAQGFDGGAFNMVYAGCEGQMESDAWTMTSGKVTDLETTERIAEKPFLYRDSAGYAVFVPQMQRDTKGVTWKDGFGGEAGERIPLEDFYLANAQYDTSATLNAALESGQHLLFTPGIYVLDAPLKVNLQDTVLLGLGYATLKLGDGNSEAAIEVGDVGGVRIADFLLDAGPKSEHMAVIGTENAQTDHSKNPVVLSNFYCRIGGVENVHTETDVALAIHANDVIGDNFWIWRADHSQGVAWNDEETKNGTNFGNPARTGVLVTGDRVSCYALMVEHFEDFQTLWEGEDGCVVMYQSETPYRVPEQSLWMSHDGAKNGCASYKVADTVERHRGIGIGVYLVSFTGMTLDSAIEVPEKEGIKMEHLITCNFSMDHGGKIARVINGYGGEVDGNVQSARVPKYPI